MRARPNFFLIGAPKCGTTALSEYLRQHPNIGFSNPKEPHYFCTDFQNFRFAKDEEDYLTRCFAGCTGQEIAIGEGSVHYLYSDEAIPNILAFNPKAKFIVMLRNPIEMVLSLHNQLLVCLDEDVESFEDAWNLQATRAAMEAIPRRCREPKFLQYKDYGRIGALVERLFNWVPKEQRLVILFDDFTSDTRSVYQNVLRFLKVPDDGLTHFPVINERRANRSRLIAEFTQRPPPHKLAILIEKLKNLIGVERLGILPVIVPLLESVNSRKAANKEISEALYEALTAAFEDDIKLLASLLERDLSHWLNRRAP